MLIIIYIFLIWAIMYIIRNVWSGINREQKIKNLTKQSIVNKSICVADLMQQVIDEANHCLNNIPTGGLDWTYNRFKKELSELQRMVSETSVNDNLTVRIDNEYVPLRNIIVGAQLFETELKRRFPTL